MRAAAVAPESRCIALRRAASHCTARAAAPQSVHNCACGRYQFMELWCAGIIGCCLCVRTKIDNNGNHWLT
ncbi:hypothetical protein HMPREF9248_0240 [Fannyhessea vaginae PB189-T1-4]|uniref:Uncharacterized protein n=1 Tax=Fannyhessea vaginae PB189-T1-4 TaxID=866774 RepID=A0ABP2J1H3_9ACTN|nr:hypothetical protein HMPREF9248_0240 [Fannyhessea vaginae PB189-T1-4]